MDFVTGVSHELRTPLSVILSASENIQDGVVSTPSQVARYGSVIYRQARQLMQLVEQVLLFASSRQSRLHLQVRPVELNSILERALENAGTHGCKVERQIEPGLPLVLADPTALTQALQNIIANAVKYGAPDGCVGVHASRCASPSGEEVSVSIEDHGIGISHEELPHIFDPFYRSPNVAGSNVHGTGLGLPLARSLVEAMGGSITVESEPGRGSSFTVHLRISDAQVPPEDTRAANEATSRLNS
jgi:signal transduction histidine kinase